jgi:Flp pilus assembly protein protease CpaA
MPNLELVQWGVAGCASLVAAITDVRSGRIPNALTLPLWLTGVGAAAYFGGLGRFGEAVGASVLLASPYILLFIVGHGGAGDAKMMGALGAWLGLRHGVVVLVSVAITGMILAVLKILAHSRRRTVVTDALASLYVLMVELCSRYGGLSPSKHDGERPTRTSDAVTIPYGIAICIGVCISGVGLWIWSR